MVHNEDKPSQVIRNRNTSMYMAIDAVRRGEAKAIVSAGNTGALMAISKLSLKTIQKIHRPAIVSIMPHLSGRYVMLDLGANTECDGLNLAEFALMGNIVAKNALRDYPTNKHQEELNWIILQSKYQQTINSVDAKKMDRARDTEDEYYNFITEYPESKHRSAAERIGKEMMKILEHE